MKLHTWMAGVAVFTMAGWAVAERPGNFSFENRVRVAYDDNVEQTEEDTQSSLRLTEEATFSGSARMDNTFLSLRYKVELNWYEDRADESTDGTHTVDFIWNQTLSRRLSFSLADTFRAVGQPELVREDGTLRRRDSTYIYNTLHGTLTTVLTGRTRLDTSARYVIMRYDEDLLAERDDYDLMAGGLTLRGQVSKDTSAFLDVRAENIDYVNAGAEQPDDIFFPGTEQVRRTVPDRSADTLSAGIGADHVFGANLVGVFRMGMTYKEYQAANTSSETGPYADGSLTFTVSPVTRVTLGLSHQLYQSSLISFVNQQRTAGDIRVGHDLTPRLSLTLSGGVVRSEYDSEDTVDTISPAEVTDGNETALTASARLSYRIGENNWLETGWSYTDLDTELRTGYTRNVYDMAWRIRL